MHIFFLLDLLELRATSSLSGLYASIDNKGLVEQKLSSVGVWRTPAWPSDSSWSEAQNDLSPSVALHNVSGGILERGRLLVCLGFFCNHHWINPFLVKPVTPFIFFPGENSPLCSPVWLSPRQGHGRHLTLSIAVVCRQLQSVFSSWLFCQLFLPTLTTFCCDSTTTWKSYLDLYDAALESLC